MVKISAFGQDPLINMFSLSCGHFVNMLVILSDNILLPFVDGTDLFDANFIKKRNFIIKCTTYVHILHTVLLDCNATSTPKLISWLIVKMSTGVHVL